MDEAARVIARLERIELLRAGAAPGGLTAGRRGPGGADGGAAGARAGGRGVGAGGGRRPGADGRYETSGGGRRNALRRTEMRLHMGLARLLPRPNIRPASVVDPGETQVIALANQKGGVAKKIG